MDAPNRELEDLQRRLAAAERRIDQLLGLVMTQAADLSALLEAVGSLLANDLSELHLLSASASPAPPPPPAGETEPPPPPFGGTLPRPRARAELELIFRHGRKRLLHVLLERLETTNPGLAARLQAQIEKASVYVPFDYDFTGE